MMGKVGISFASGRTTNVQSSLGGTVPGLNERFLVPANPQSFRDIWPSGPVPAEIASYDWRSPSCHAKTYDLESVHQWRPALILHTNVKSNETIFSCA